MAVTLQLARITAEQLAECRRSTAVLDRLCSFKLVPASEYLDLDWANTDLIRMCERTGIGDATAMRRATHGDDDVNLAYRYTVMEQPRLLEPADVAILAAALRGIDLDEGFSSSPASSGIPRDYLTRHFIALRDFYAEAADRHLAIVVWCD